MGRLRLRDVLSRDRQATHPVEVAGRPIVWAMAAVWVWKGFEAGDAVSAVGFALLGGGALLMAIRLTYGRAILKGRVWFPLEVLSLIAGGSCAYIPHPFKLPVGLFLALIFGGVLRYEMYRGSRKVETHG